MALKLNFDICVINSCGQLRFNETTWSYSTSNTGGYGSPNPTSVSASAASLVITNPSGTSYTVDLYSTGLYPTYNNTIYYDIPLSSIGNPSKIDDGEWTFVYSVTISGVTYTKEIHKYLYCNMQCCVDSMLPVVDLCDCCSETIEYSNYNTDRIYLESLKAAAKCSDRDKFESLRKIVEKLCLINNCKTCK